MRVGIVLEQELSSGGGFQQALNAIEQLYQICPEWLSISLFTTVEVNVKHDALVRKDIHFIKRDLKEKILCAILSQSESILSTTVLSRTRTVSHFEKVLIANKVDLVYFLTPSGYATVLRSIPYIFTIWDLCHRDHPEFPEVSNYGEFVRRENLYRHAINRSYLTLTDSEELSNRVTQRYGTDVQRLLVMPFQPGRFTTSLSATEGESAIERLALPSDYVFYPAQFWPHKNHVRILLALAMLKERGLTCNVVFCGGDRGNRSYLQEMARKINIETQVVFAGFVAESDMNSIYQNCRALVMPTYFGPTNLPPLEAWVSKKPVIYSSLLRDQVGDAAICVNPDSTEELADAISLIYSNDPCIDVLIERGLKKFQVIEHQRIQAEKMLLEKLQSFRSRRLCWGNM